MFIFLFTYFYFLSFYLFIDLFIYLSICLFIIIITFFPLNYLQNLFQSYLSALTSTVLDRKYTCSSLHSLRILRLIILSSLTWSLTLPSLPVHWDTFFFSTYSFFIGGNRTPNFDLSFVHFSQAFSRSSE